jgi:ribonuclease HII
VVAAAVILPLHQPDKLALLTEVRDSKKMTLRQRERAFEQIQNIALSVGVGVSDNRYIDQHRIIAATRHAMHQALSQLNPPAEYLLLDALALPEIDLPQEAFYKADSISLTVACASVIAKVSRDRLMVEFDTTYPGYGFAQHKGYGTKAHRAALAQRGPCEIHRFSFAPIRALLE